MLGGPAAEPPTCWKEPYVTLPIEMDGANLLFDVSNIADYGMNCDALLQRNGVFMDPVDYTFIPYDIEYNFELVAYARTGDWVAFEPITNAKQTYWLQEFYWTVQTNGYNQTLNDKAYYPFRNSRNTANSNVCLNGVLLTQNIDFYFTEATGFVFTCYLEVGDVVGILPTCANGTKGKYVTPVVPQLLFIVVSTGKDQTFADPILQAYTRAEDMIVTKDGVVLQPYVDYTFVGETITVLSYLRVQSEIIVLANSRSCQLEGGELATQAFATLITQNDRIIVTETD